MGLVEKVARDVQFVWISKEFDVEFNVTVEFIALVDWYIKYTW